MELQKFEFGFAVGWGGVRWGEVGWGGVGWGGVERGAVGIALPKMILRTMGRWVALLRQPEASCARQAFRLYGKLGAQGAGWGWAGLWV